MLALKFIAAAAVLAQGVLSEGVHLFNCSPWGAAGSERIWRSLVAVRGSLLGIPPLPPVHELMILSLHLVLRR